MILKRPVKKILAVIFLSSIINCVTAQYFQQKTDYTIQCSLDDVNNTITGDLALTYTNNSPKPIEYLYMHLHMNAYKNDKTAFAKQMKAHQKTDFSTSDKEEKGYIDGLSFVDANESALELEYDENNPDIAILRLKEPIQAGASTTIRTPFHLKLPKLFSRAGYTDNAFQVTQWFPRTAVYDMDGWHPLPYLNQGEFYNDFGDYDVTITVPEDYIIASTGVEQKINETTYNYKAKNVVDFAWFASKNIKVEKETVELPNGKSTDVFVYYTPGDENWQQSLKYATRALNFFSEKIGSYPHPVLRIVQSGSIAGAGMEYPMITNIELPELDAFTRQLVNTGELLDEIIAHEIAHNWFQATLATNERDFPWMDEGMTSYFEQLYMAKFNQPSPFAGQDIAIEMQHVRSNKKIQLFYPDEHTPELNYYLFYYVYSPKMIRYLSGYLGEETMETIFREYYTEWAGKHPQPEDFFNAISSNTDKDVTWFIEDIVKNPSVMDYAITKANEESFTIKNKQSVSNPFPVVFYNAEGPVSEMWIEGFSGVQSFTYPSDINVSELTEIKIDPQSITNDYYNTNNRHLMRKSAQVNKTVQRANTSNSLVKFGGYNLTDDRPTIFPVIGYNLYDKFSAGVAFHNYDAFESKLEYYAIPMFGFGSSEVVGFAGVDYSLGVNKGFINKLKLGLHGKSFNFNTVQDEDLRYATIKPRITGYIKSKKENLKQSIALTLPINHIESFNNDNDLAFYPNLVYDLTNTKGNNKYGLEAKLEFQEYELFSRQQNYLTLEIEADYSATYSDNKSIDLSFYSGISLFNTRREFPASSAEGGFSFIQNGAADYEFDGNFIGRSEQDGFWSQQVLFDGAKGLLPITGSAVGVTNNFAFSFLARADLPFNPISKYFPLKPYVSAFLYEFRPQVIITSDPSENFFYSSGLSLDFLNEAIVIALPLLWNDSGSEVVEPGDHSVKQAIVFGDHREILKRIVFAVDLRKLAPRRLDETLSNF